MSTKITTKGQVTIPKEIRDLLDLKPGSKVRFRYSNNEIIMERDDGAPGVSRFDKMRGHAGPGMSTDQIMKLLRGEDD